MEIELLSDIFRLFGISVLVLFVCSRLGIPTIVGFLVTGLVAGPHGLGLVEHIHAVEVMAEVGVVLLLFTIGMEFSIEQLLRIKKAVLLGGALQVGPPSAARPCWPALPGSPGRKASSPDSFSPSRARPSCSSCSRKTAPWTRPTARPRWAS